MLEVRQVAVRFGDLAVLGGVDLTVADGEVVAVLGASGSGKTTLLRAVAGLIRPDRGSILWDGADLAVVPPHLRGFGLVFQDFALFPHLDVGRNVEFGLRMQGLAPAERTPPGGRRPRPGRPGRNGAAQGGHTLRRPGAAGGPRPVPGSAAPPAALRRAPGLARPHPAPDLTADLAPPCGRRAPRSTSPTTRRRPSASPTG